jgi:O-acetyl-ADP-ribose deacetylase (regulator of RNase III)
MQEVLLLGWCDVGSATITKAGNLKYKYIVHAIGPRWGEVSARGKLASATWETLRVAEAYGLKSIAIPPISTGAAGYPVENCAKTMLSEIIDFTFEDLKHLRYLIICTKSEPEHEAFVREFQSQIEELKNTGEGKVKV